MERSIKQEIEWCRKQIAEYKRIFAALSTEEQEKIRDLHYLGLADLVMEELLLEKSYFQLKCHKCNTEFTCFDAEGKCPKCGIAFVVVWPAEPPTAVKDARVSVDPLVSSVVELSEEAHKSEDPHRKYQG